MVGLRGNGVKRARREDNGGKVMYACTGMLFKVCQRLCKKEVNNCIFLLTEGK